MTRLMPPLVEETTSVIPHNIIKKNKHKIIFAGETRAAHTLTDELM